MYVSVENSAGTRKCKFFAKTVILESVNAYVILMCCKNRELPEDGVRGSFQNFCTLYIFSLKMNLFYKIHLQAFNVISIVLYHSGQTFGQVLHSCQDAFVVDMSDYLRHIIRHLLSASEAFPTERLFQFWEQVKGWWAHVRTVRRVGKHLPPILFQDFRYYTWGMRPRVNVWSLVTARDLTAVGFFFHFKAPFCGTQTT